MQKHDNNIIHVSCWLQAEEKILVPTIAYIINFILHVHSVIFRFSDVPSTYELVTWSEHAVRSHIIKLLFPVIGRLFHQSDNNTVI